jgi:hypothetical protein
MKILLFTLAVCIAFGKVGAQDNFEPGYYISLTGDTVTGFVTPYSPKTTHCQFRKQATSAVETFDPAMIAGFGTFAEERYFQSFSLPAKQTVGKKVFAELLLRGRADLYGYNDFFYLAKDDMSERIEKVQQKKAADGSGNVYEHKIFIGTLNRYFSDCLPEKLLKGEVAYRERDFIEVFRKYSECSGTDYHVYKSAPQRRTLGYYLLAGLNNSRLTYPGDLDIFKPDNNFFFGAGITVPLPFIGNQIFLTGEVMYHHNEYRGVKNGFTPTGTVSKDYLMKVSVIKLPVGFKLNLTQRGIVPYLRIGATPFFKTGGTAEIRYQGNTEEYWDVDERTPTVIIWGGAGMQANIGSRRSLFAEFRVDHANNYVDFYGPNGRANNRSSLLDKMLIFGVNF